MVCNFVYSYLPSLELIVLLGCKFEIKTRETLAEIGRLSKSSSAFSDILHTGEVVKVVVKLLTVSADMMEANHMAGCLGPGANVPCKKCILAKSEFDEKMFDGKIWGEMLKERTSEKARQQREEASRYGAGQAEEILSTYGLHKTPSPIEKHIPAIDIFLQSSRCSTFRIERSEPLSIQLYTVLTNLSGISNLMIRNFFKYYVSDKGKKVFSAVLQQKFDFPMDVSK